MTTPKQIARRYRRLNKNIITDRNFYTFIKVNSIVFVEVDEGKYGYKRYWVCGKAARRLWKKVVRRSRFGRHDFKLCYAEGITQYGKNGQIENTGLSLAELLKIWFSPVAWPPVIFEELEHQGGYD